MSEKATYSMLPFCGKLVKRDTRRLEADVRLRTGGTHECVRHED